MGYIVLHIVEEQVYKSKLDWSICQVQRLSLCGTFILPYFSLLALSALLNTFHTKFSQTIMIIHYENQHLSEQVSKEGIFIGYVLNFVCGVSDDITISITVHL